MLATDNRPWPVYVLVALSIAGLIWAQFSDEQRNLWDILAIATSLPLAWGLWTGRGWAYSISFMLASLCTGLVLVVALVQVFLMEQGLDVSLLRPIAFGGLWIGLLQHPASKRFAGLASHHIAESPAN